MVKKLLHRHVIPGSERSPMPSAQAVGVVTSDERFEVTVRLRSKAPPSSLMAGSVQADLLPGQRQYLSREEFAAQHGADPQDMAKVATFAQAHQLVVVESDAARRSVVLSGTTATLSAAFGVTLQQFEHDAGTYRGRTGSISVPAELAGIIEGVFGLDDRPQAATHFRRLPADTDIQGGVAIPRASSSAGTSFTPPQLASLYQFPTDLDGHGQCIGIIELGGGFKAADVKKYFADLGLPTPRVKAICIDGGRNHPTNAQSVDGEVMLDIEVAAGVAPKALIAIYFAPNTDQGFLDAITTAVHDSVNKPSVISISWGSAESNWTPQSMTQLDQTFQAAAAMGVTICCAAGGNNRSATDGKSHAEFPASSPFVLGCGGTRLTASGSIISSEVAWNEGPNNATGGGVSSFFSLPTYQSQAGVPPPAGTGGRGVPDVAGNADPASGYQVRVDGQNLVFGGGGAVAPLWAGLIALMNQKLGDPVGFLNPLLYGSLAGRGLFNDITTGNNGSFAAGQGWDARTGWGSPIGVKLLQALGGNRVTSGSQKSITGSASITGSPSQTPDNRQPEGSVVVWFGTDRCPQPAEVDAASSFADIRNPDDTDPISFGKAIVSIPANHIEGKLERPPFWSRREDSKKHIILVAVTVLSENNWTNDAKNSESEGFLFLHGFNVSFEDALLRTAQLTFDLKFDGVSICYSWASANKLVGYMCDRTTIEWSVDNLRRFLQVVTRNLNLKKLHIIAHSMGNVALAKVLSEWAEDENSTPISQVVMAAPDIDTDVFKQLATRFKGFNQVTLYASRSDRAIRASKELQGYPRAGDADPPCVVSGISTIDVSSAGEDIFGLRHSFFVSSAMVFTDLYYLIRGLLPKERKSLYPSKSGDYFILRHR